MQTTLDAIISQTEGQYFERKNAKIAPKDIIKHLIGFANAGGGMFVIGIEDDGEITGFKKPKAHSVSEYLHAVQTLQKIPIVHRSEVVAVQNSVGESDELLVFHIEPSLNRVIEADDGTAYLRSKDQTLLLKYEQRKQLEYDKGQRNFEDEIVPDADFSDLDIELLEEYKRHLNSTSALDEILYARNLMNKSGQITNAGILLFGKNPSRYFPNARIKVLKYDGTTQKTGSQINIIKEFQLEGAIPKIITQARQVVASQLREFQTLDDNGNFVKMDEYPEFAWFEGIVNAVTHRSYAFLGDYIRVSIYDNRLEIFSPGKLPNIVTVENMLNTRYSRNPRIARILSEFGWVKELNEGVKRIFNEMEQCFLHLPTYQEPNGDSVLLSLENNILQRALRANERLDKIINEKTVEFLSDFERKALQYAYQNEKVMVKDLANHLLKSDTFARNLLKSLRDKELVVWVGNSRNDPTQYYKLNVE